jgi:hypothetical protein
MSSNSNSSLRDLKIGSIRKKILDALEKSIKIFSDEAELTIGVRQDVNTASKVNWAVNTARQAFKDIDVFWHNSLCYSEEPVPEYLWIYSISHYGLTTSN